MNVMLDKIITKILYNLIILYNPIIYKYYNIYGKVNKSNHKANLYSYECGNYIHADLNANRNITNKFLEQQAA